ncbi:MAG: hypothetical protein INR71_12065 [Terriglobus roseus]|nr:hypothetical protein [Terriglobus roseus]
MGAQFTPRKNITAPQFENFRKQKGPSGGNASNTFYGAYCFFEKLRLANGKAKSAHREQMERVWGAEGFDIKHGSSHGFWCHSSERPFEDQYGQVTFHKI